MIKQIDSIQKPVESKNGLEFIRLYDKYYPNLILNALDYDNFMELKELKLKELRQLNKI